MTATLDSRINRLKIKSKICAVSRSCFLPVFFANRHTLPLRSVMPLLYNKRQNTSIQPAIFFNPVAEILPSEVFANLPAWAKKYKITPWTRLIMMASKEESMLFPVEAAG
jgi:hypothetical protein